MSLLDEIDAAWVKAKGESSAKKWADVLIENKNKIIKAGKKFHDWDPLRTYLSLTRTANPKVVFSLRYQGQEVADLAINGKERLLEISSDTAKTNTRDFGINTVCKCSWDAPEAVAFRKAFKRHAKDKTGKVTEHRIEAEFLKQMAIDTRKKFGGTLKNIQPVLFAGFPLQFPLPISGNKGKPYSTSGNIDILARRGVGKGTKISIWELKKPNARADQAIMQAYIYAVTLIKVLRSEKRWYEEIIGFNGKIPKKLTIESVVAVSFTDEKKKTDFVEKLEKFKKENELQIGNDTIKLYVAHYSYETSNKGSPLTIKNKPFKEE
jgi:hypothetical protein